jgi:hypothetical protein
MPAHAYYASCDYVKVSRPSQIPEECIIVNPEVCGYNNQFVKSTCLSCSTWCGTYAFSVSISTPAGAPIRERWLPITTTTTRNANTQPVASSVGTTVVK